MNRVVGSERSRAAREFDRRCWGIGRSVWNMPDAEVSDDLLVAIIYFYQ